MDNVRIVTAAAAVEGTRSPIYCRLRLLRETAGQEHATIAGRTTAKRGR